MALPTSQYSLSLRDFSGEKSQVQWSGEQITGAAFDVAAWEATHEAIADAVMLLTDCTRGKEQFSSVSVAGSEALPAIATAQREVGLRIFYQDDVTGKKYHLTIPGPQVEDYPAAGTDELDITSGDLATFVGLFEADAESEAGNAVTVYAGRLVGRRN
jgi:hypothetical protein